MAFQLIRRILSINNYSGDLKPTLIAEYVCDTQSDLPARSQTNYYIGIGSEATVIEDSSKWRMKSDGTWVMYETGIAIYTKGEQIPIGSDFDDYTDLGVYYVASNADAATMTNIPDSYGGRLEVIATISNDTYVKQTYICNDDQGLIYTRRKLSDGWSTWQLMTPKPASYGVGTAIIATVDNPFDLDTLQTIGRYTFGGTTSANLLNKPSNLPAYGGEITVERVQLTNRYRQTIYLNSNLHTGKMWVRQAYSGTAPNLSWSAWYLFEGTQV